MNNKGKIIVVIAVVATIIVASTVFYFISLQPEPITLSYNGEILKLISGKESWYIDEIYYAYQGEGTWQYFNGTSWVLVSIDNLPVPYTLSLNFHSDATVYNCQVEISYRNTNGTWLRINQNIGIVDLSKNVQFELENYKIEPNISRTADKTVQFDDLSITNCQN